MRNLNDLQTPSGRFRLEGFDIVVENISIVNNYRSQFNRVLSNASWMS